MGLAYKWRRLKIFRLSSLFANSKVSESVNDTIEIFTWPRILPVLYIMVTRNRMGMGRTIVWNPAPLHLPKSSWGSNKHTSWIQPDYAYYLEDSILPNTLCELVLSNGLSSLYEYYWRKPDILTCVGNYHASNWQLAWFNSSQYHSPPLGVYLLWMLLWPREIVEMCLQRTRGWLQHCCW